MKTLIDSEFNNKLIKLAPKHLVSDIAPDTFGKLVSQASSGSRLVVWSGGSDQTIYGDSKVNYAFRAWHDQLHLKLNAPFTLEGETIVATEQCRLISSTQMAQLIMAEVIGQVEHVLKTGEFPVNQIDFIRNYIKGLV